MPGLAPLILVNAVGMTRRLLPHAPRMARRGRDGQVRGLIESIPAVTSTAQASLLTGEPPNHHGIVANGWLFRETREVRFWQQSNYLLQAEPIYRTLKQRAAERGESFRVAKLFWWFNQGSGVDWSVTPKPHYGADGNKVFAIASNPDGLAGRLEEALGPFPFHAFWGPMAGLASTRWIAACAAKIVEWNRPELTMVYLPHLDYEPQRRGPAGCDMPKLVGELDDAFAVLDDVATRIGARVWIVSEYGHCDVTTPIFPNRILRQHRLLKVRRGPFGEMVDTFDSPALAVCDHQLCHIYVKDANTVAAVAEMFRETPGIARTLVGEARREIQLDHHRSGEIVLLCQPDHWFAYPYWIEDSAAPDFARTVDIHRKIGFDPCEMFLDPALPAVKARMALRLLQKKIGFRTLFDVIPLDATIVRGSHGLAASDPADRPIFITDTTKTPEDLPLMDVYREILGGMRDKWNDS